MPTVAELAIDVMARGGVPRIFGAPGGGDDLGIVDAATAAGLPFVRCRLEWAACIMAAVTGELTGRPGAALAAPGADRSGSVTGLAYAWLDRSPMLYLSEGFAEPAPLDHTALLAPILKDSMALTRDSASHLVARAVSLALAEPRGPVHVALPVYVARQTGAVMAWNDEPAALSAPETVAVDQAGAMILGAKRPLVIAGLQCRRSDARWLRAFCEALPAPVLTTYKAKGAIPDPHPLSMGTLTGGERDAPIIERADLIIGFGVDPAEIPHLRCGAPVVSFVRCPSTARPVGGGRSLAPVLELVGDLGSILEELAPRLVGRSRADWDVVEVDRLRRARRVALEPAVPGLAPHRIVQLAREHTPAGTVATVGAGAAVLPVTAHWQAVEPGELLISNGLATSGFALPAAIAGQLAFPERQALCFTDVGGLTTVAAELETVVELQLPILIVVLDDRARSPFPDPARLARAFGFEALLADDEPAFRSALVSSLRARRPTLIAARVDLDAIAKSLGAAI